MSAVKRKPQGISDLHNEDHCPFLKCYYLNSLVEVVTSEEEEQEQ